MHKVFAAALLCLLAGAPALAEDVKPIRDFDIATIESLGQRIYRQDQLAWKATDILLEKHSGSELKRNKARGWIVDDALNRVRFLRDGANGPEAAYDVTLAPGSAPVLSEPQDRSLTPSELAQHKARLLATENFDFRCTSDSPNTVALPDPQGKGWLVWVMSATSDTDKLVVAGHIRFTISEDGSTIIQKDKLSKGCMVMDKPRQHDRNTPAGQMFTNLVSLKPLETQVFASLAYSLPMYIGTMDGRTWKIDAGRISEVDEVAPEMDGAAARFMAGMDEICSPIFAFTEKEGFKLGTTTQVINELEHKERLEVTVPQGMRLAAVICVRNSIIPSPNDYKLLAAGVNLFLSDKGAGHPKRRAEMVVKSGKLQLNVDEGVPLNAEENARLAKRLEKMQIAYDKTVK